MQNKYKREISKYLLFNEKVKEWKIEFFSNGIHITVTRYNNSQFTLHEKLIGIDKIIKMLESYI